MRYHVGDRSQMSNPRMPAAIRSARPPAVAGQFYDTDPRRLQAEIEQLLATAPRQDASVRPKAIIAPHAGYRYSGQVAATAMAALSGYTATIERVILIGPAHYVPFRGIAAPTVRAFETPLGLVPLDQDVLAALRGLVRFDDAPHAPEHALEVELPFLQVLTGSITAVPLLVGNATSQEVAAVLKQLWGGPETVIVVSSDLSHFLDYDSARRRDAETAAMIERGAWADIGPQDACGYLAIAGLLLETTRFDLKGTGLSLCNSGDSAGPRDRVVGYGAWMFAD